MTSHAQPVERRSTGIDKDEQAGPGDSVSVAKMTMIGTIGGALVTAVATIFVAIGPGDDSGGTTGTEPTTITPTLTEKSRLGSFDQVAINGSRSEVALTGSAEKNVESVVVLIGPRHAGGQFWAASANVVDEQWNVVVATEPQLPEPYQIKAFYRVRASDVAGIQKASGFTFQTTDPPPPPPAPEVICAVEHGDSCFTGPGWGTPSIYESDQ